MDSWRAAPGSVLTRSKLKPAISPAGRNRDETLSTLAYASRAKRIVNCVTKNVIEDDDSRLVQMKTEIESHVREKEELEAKLRDALSTEQQQELRNEVHEPLLTTLSCGEGGRFSSGDLTLYHHPRLPSTGTRGSG